jgi:type I restriction-modification system DNA methylase subunit
MNITQIEENIRILFSSPLREDYIYDILRIYGLPKASITRLQKGNLNMSKNDGDIIWKKKLNYRKENEQDLHECITAIRHDLKHKERFVIVTDDETLLAYDTKTDDTLDIPLSDWPEYYDFFLPWAGIEKTEYQNENPADVKAAEKMAKLFDEIKKDNPQEDPVFRHHLNVFLSRILFCLFAEDTGIFDEDAFTNAIGSHTKADGSDLHLFLDRLFGVLNTSNRKREKLPAYLKVFPYVNGGLFEQSISAPTFTRKSRQAIIAAGTLQWKDINPDIFGSMFQAVIGADQRGSLGQHYTSVPNIMKVIEPLFLNELREEYENAKSKKSFEKLLTRIWNIKIFDPACGSGNFLIIAYKELRKLEIDIFQSMKIPLPFSGIELGHFYGIEYDDFAGEIAKLALWLAEHQMNSLFKRTFGKTRPTLPLKEAGQIVHGNACRLDWEEVCPKEEGDEIYILGNPPYLGARNQSKEQKEDISIVLKSLKGRNGLDYIACWFYKASLYIKGTRGQFAFVSTNSICQGQQVSFLWPSIFEMDNQIQFAYPAFYWSNNAKHKAVVAVIIVGVSPIILKKPKAIILENNYKNVINISPYLTEGSNRTILKRQVQLSNLPAMIFGNQSVDGGNLILSDSEKNELLTEDHKSKKFIRKFYGWNNLSKNVLRWCLWISEDCLDEAFSIKSIKDRINGVKDFRENGGQVAVSLIDIPYRFRYIHEAKKNYLVLGRNSSVLRDCLAIDLIETPSIIGETLQVIHDPEPFLFSLLSSRIHMNWVKAVSGGMKLDILYSVTICYNTFPFPPISDTRKQELTESTFRILEERENHPEKTLAELYDPDKMPDGLREAHRLNDLAVERCYRSKPFQSDEERLEYLFKLYEKMIQNEQDKETLFAKEKKVRKKKKK